VNGRWLLVVIAANLLALLGLALIYPHLMVSPGPLVQPHAALATDCFACHAPFQGATSERCTSCHAVASIGRTTTKGEPLAKQGERVARPTIKAAFHQELLEQNCTACHSDHPRQDFTGPSRRPFSHSLLRETTRDRCGSCHTAPDTDLHRNVSGTCAQCHSSKRWKPAAFKHALLAKEVLAHCEGCHSKPTDTLHEQLTGDCQQCHRPEHWKPATFDHDTYFVLDGAHRATCVTCHLKSDYTRYTCYGCHAHTPNRVRAQHQEEGIRDVDNCVRCHRSAAGEHGGEGSREGRE